MTEQALAVFLDTNCLLHYPPVIQVDWVGLCSARRVRLVLCMQVVHELDVKKSDPRLRERAARAIKEITTLRSAAGVVRDGVTLEVFNYELRSDDFPDVMSSESPDDRIVLSAKLFAQREGGHAVAVCTEDLGMSLRCEAAGVRVIQPARSTRLPDPQDEHGKRVKQLTEELNALKSRLPVFVIRAEPPDTEDFEEKPRFALKRSWRTLDPEAEVEKVRGRLQPPARPSTPGSLLSRVIPDPLSGIYPEEKDRYERELNDYFGKFRHYLELLNQFHERRARTLVFDLFLVNDGRGPATEIDFSLVLPERLWPVLRETDERHPLISEPVQPTPPERPKARVLPGLPGYSLGNAIARFAENDRLADVIASHQIKDKVEVFRAEGGQHLIVAKIQSLKHTRKVHLGRIHAIFRDWSEIDSFQAEYEVSANELPQRESGTLPFLLSVSE